MIAGIAHDLVDLPDDSLEAINDYFYEQRWTDGATIVPPTVERVEAMLAATPLPHDRVLGEMGPTWRPASVYHVAVNAVMAGCKPAYFPVVLAGIEAILERSFNLFGTQGTTNPSGVMLMVNGPLAKTLEVNSGYNVFGQGWRANMTIGRAVRLCMINIGGGYPGISDMSTQGNPIKLGICFAENEEANPWGPLHLERGFDASTSTVTAFSCVTQHVIVRDAEPEPLLDQVAAAMLCAGSNARHMDGQPGIVFGPLHAGWLHAGGYDKPKIRRYLFERARIDADLLAPVDRRAILKTKTANIREEEGRWWIYPAASPDDIVLAVAGGSVGQHTVVAQTFNGTHVVTKPVVA